MNESRFLAFLLANDKEEFLASYENCPGVVKRAWTMFPDHAKRFPFRRAAEHAIRKLEAGYPVYIVQLFDDGDRFLVSADEDGPRPSWLVTEFP